MQKTSTTLFTEDPHKPSNILHEVIIVLVLFIFCSPNDDELKEKAAYLMQKSRYHEFEPETKKKGKDLIKRLDRLNEDLERRKMKTSLDL